MTMRPGICGIISFDEKGVDDDCFDRMQSKLSGNSTNKTVIRDWYALAQSGYESTGYEDNCLLEDDTKTICFEGRIDNRRSLAGELGIESESGYSKLIHAAFARWGKNLYQKILGAFTICIVVKHDNKILIANDHMGLRPLYLSEVGSSQLAFGSDVSQLLAKDNTIPSFNRNKVLEMLSPMYVDDESWSDPNSTLIEGVTVMPHANALEVDRQGKRIETRYWKPSNRLRREWKDIPSCAEEFRGIYMNVMKDQLDTQYPIGADLSGGIDSGCNVAAIATLLRQQNRTEQGLHTFTAKFEEGDFTEKDKIDAVLREWPFIQQHYIQGDDLCGYLESGQYRELRTTANCVRMNIPESYVAICQLASRLGCRSVITGEAADWYLEGTDVIWDSLIKSGKISEFIKSANVLKKRAKWKTLIKYLYLNGVRPLLGRGKYVEEYYEATINAKVPDLFTDSFREDLIEFIQEQTVMLMRQPQLSVWNQQLEHELMFPPNHGWQGIAVDTELRLPYLDKRLVEFGLTVPPEYKFQFSDDRISHYGSRKCLQRYGLDDIAPKKIIQSQHKEAYSTPVDNRLATSLPIVLANADTALVTQMDITDPNKLQEAIKYVLSDQCIDHSDPVVSWLDTLLGLELWLKATRDDFGLK